ncbi:universal stress protein family protein [Blastococcus colisei]|uniref:Universal stress protein family protein n=1 Tax=Blastococcus colisei TaxID=1564162 RepID=A0A543PHL3_9ACTN|nr:universal stress protein [Blastococcus colisei]TQN43571.1 universal stress protein family protein [Blastococcus colisei]
MSSPADRPPVVVPVPTASEDALDWAAAEAAARGLSLRLVHPFRTPLPVDPFGLAPPADVPPPRTTAAQLLDDALRRARAVAADLVVETALVPGSTRRVLLHESRTAGLLVLGGHSSDPFSRVRAVRARLRLAAVAACPVTVVGALPRAAGPRPSPRVVVGIDGTPTSGAAVGFAVRAARQRGIALAVVHAWTADPPADLEGVCACRVATEADALRLVDRTLAPWRAEFPDVPVTADVRSSDAASALVAVSDGAALVVLGAPGRHPLTRGFGAVGPAVLARVGSPVVVVGHEGWGTATTRRGVRRLSSR